MQNAQQTMYFATKLISGDFFQHIVFFISKFQLPRDMKNTFFFMFILKHNKYSNNFLKMKKILFHSRLLGDFHSSPNPPTQIMSSNCFFLSFSKFNFLLHYSWYIVYSLKASRLDDGVVLLLVPAADSVYTLNIARREVLNISSNLFLLFSFKAHKDIFQFMQLSSNLAGVLFAWIATFV